MRTHITLWLLAGLFALTSAPAAAQRYSALLDTDQNTATGCTVATAAGTVSGVEWRITATVDGIPQQVVAVERAQCQGGVFTAPIAQLAGYPVGLNNGLAGADVVESAVVLAQLSGLRGESRLHLLAESNEGANLVENIVLPLPGFAPFQPPELIPTLQWIGIAILIFAMLLLARRNRALRGVAVVMMLVGVGVVWAANFMADGLVGDWVGETPRAVGPPDNGSNGDAAVQIRAVWAATEAGQAFFRFDVLDVENQAPVADALTEATLEDLSVTIILSGSDPEGSPLSFSITQAPTNGTLGAITPLTASTAEVIYTPTADFNGSDSFSYSSSDGQYDSAPALVSITITPVNDAPSFVGQDAIIFESGGAQTATIATALSAGPADEAGQSLSFEIVSNDNPALFTAGPVIAADGTLSATPVADQAGTATLSVQLRDDGGIANGGVDVSVPQTIVLTVQGINRAPSFTAGADVAVLEDAAAYNQPWATALDDGDGGSQILTFDITANSNPALFSAGPVIDGATGNLSFTLTPDANGSATITALLRDNGGTANGGVDSSTAVDFIVTVTAVNDAPSYTLTAPPASLEDAGAQLPIIATSLSAGPADEVGQTLNFNLVQTGIDPTMSFAAAPSISPTGQLSYTAAANAWGTASFELSLSDNGGTANGGVDTSPAQVFQITVTPVNDAPSFTAVDPPASDEDVGPVVVAGWVTAFDPGPNEAGQGVAEYLVVVTGNLGLFSTAPAVTVAGDLSYEAAPDAFGVATIDVRVRDDGGIANGGVDTSPAQSFTITVNPVNDAPVVDLSGPGVAGTGFVASFTEAGGAVAIVDSAELTVTDIDSAQLQGARITIGTLLDGTDELLAVNVGGTGLLAAYDSALGELSLTGAATLATYQQVLRTTTYSNASTNPNQSNRLVGFVVTDAEGAASVAATSVVSVLAVNTAPSFTPGADVTVLEDAPAYNAAWATNLDDGDGGGQVLTFVVSNNSNPGLFSAGPVISGTTGNLSFALTPDANGSANITLQLQDDGGTGNGGSDTSAAQSFTITVDPVNDAPVLDLSGPGVAGLDFTASFTEAGGAVAIVDSAEMTVTDIDSTQLQGAVITISNLLDGTDELLAVNVGATGLVAAYDSALGELSLTGIATLATYQQVLRTSTYNNASTDPNQTNRIVEFVVTDAEGAASAAATSVVSVLAVNTAPSFTPGANVTVLEDAAAYNAAWATNLDDGDGGGQVLSFVVTNNSNPGLFSAGPVISGTTGNLSFALTPDANGSASITLQLQDNGGTASGGSDTSAPHVLTVNVTAVNDAPSYTLTAPPASLEDAGAQLAIVATALSAGPPDEVGQTLSFNLVQTGIDSTMSFTAAPSISPTGQLSYTAAPNAWGSASFELSLSDNGGTANGGVDNSPSQVFQITVTPVNDAPSFTAANPPASDEDVGPVVLAGWATAFDPGPNEAGQGVAEYLVVVTGNPALFSVAPAVSVAGDLSYQSALDAFGVATIDVRVRDNGGIANSGVDTSSAQSFTITVNPVNDAPVLDLSGAGVPGTGFAASFTEAAGAVAIVDSAELTVADIDSTQLQSARFTITNLLDGTDELLAVNVGATGLVAAYDSALGELSLTGIATLATYQQVLRTSTYNNASTDPNQTNRIVEFVVTDAEGAASAAATSVVSVLAVNTAPSFTPGANVTVLEDAAAYNAAWATNLDDGDGGGQVLTFVVTNNSNPSLFSTAPAVSGTTGNLSFALTPDANGSANITLQLQDNGGTGNGGSDTSAPHVLTINVTAVNDAPSFDIPASAPDIFENDGAQTVAGFATSMSPGPVDEAGQVLSFNVSVQSATGNLTFSTAPAIDPVSGDLTYVPAANASGVATINVTLSDNGGTANGGIATSAVQSFTISVLFVNSAPTFTPGGDVDVLEDSAAYNQPWASAMDDGDPTQTQGLTFIVQANTNPGLFSALPVINAATGNLSFTPAADAFGTANLTVALQDDGGSDNGGSDTSTPVNFVINVGAINDPPSFDLSASPPASLEDAGAQSVAAFATNLSTGPANESGQTLLGFTLVIDSADPSLTFSAPPAIGLDGELSYTAAPNAYGTATITATLRDDGGTANGGSDSFGRSFTIVVTGVNDAPSFTPGANVIVNEDSGAFNAAWATAISPGPNEAGQTLTFNITGNTAPALFSTQPAINPATGNLSFSTFPDANGSATLTVTLSDNGGTANGGFDTSAPVNFTITLTPVNDPPVVVPPTNIAVNRHIGIVIPVASGSNLLANVTDVDGPGAEPFSVTVLTNAATAQGGRVSAAANGSWDYDPPASNDLTSDSFQYQVCDSGVPLSPACTMATATIALSGNAVWFVNPSAAAGGNGTLARPFQTIAPAVTAAGANGRIFLFSGAHTGGQTLLAGQIVIGQGVTVISATSFDAMFGITPPATSVARPVIGGTKPVITTAVAATHGLTLALNNTIRGIEFGATTGAALLGNGLGTLTLGDNRISGAGQALDLTNGTLVQAGSTTAFDEITSTSGASNIALSAVGGTASFSSGALSGATGNAFSVNGGDPTIVYAGTISKTSAGRVVSLTNRSGGTVTLFGGLDCSGSCTGVLLQTNNAAALTSFRGGMSLSTGGNAAFTASGGGIVEVCDENPCNPAATGLLSNTITTTNGTALDVSNTTIGPAGLEFRTISSSGTGSGIVLNNTGAAGRLVVAGTGIAGSGGTISGKAIGISLTSTQAPSFSWMQLNDFSDFAIRGTTVAGFTLSNTVINGTNGNSGATDEGSVSFTNLTGAASISNTSISGGYEDNFKLVNNTGTLNRLTFDNVTIGTNSIVEGNDGISLEAAGTAIVNVTVQNSTFTAARGDLFQYNHIGTGTGDLVITNSTFSNNHPAIATGGGGISLFTSGLAGGNVTMSVTGNTFRDSVGDAILIVKSSGPATQTGGFSGNSVGVAGVANSGSTEGSTMRLQSVGQGALTWSVSNNFLRGYNNYGFEMRAGGGAAAEGGAINNTLSGNLIAEPGNTAGADSFAKNGLHYNIGTNVGDTFQVCANLGGAGALLNNIHLSGKDTVPPTGLGDIDFRIRNRRAGVNIRLPGYPGPLAATEADINNYIIPRNNQGGTPFGTAHGLVGTFTGTGTTCP